MTYKMRPSNPTSQKYIIRTTNSLVYRTANVAVFAPDNTVFADIANAVEGGNMQKLKQIPRLFETFEYSCDGNWLGYTPAESTVLDRQLYLTLEMLCHGCNPAFRDITILIESAKTKYPFVYLQIFVVFSQS